MKANEMDRVDSPGKRANYGGLDWLKLIAALLVVANHTSPLTSVSPDADFLLSGILSRIAVPIFFMTSGFFYFRKLNGDPRVDREAMYGYLRKIGKLYAVALLLYVPLNLYTGYFTEDFSAYSLMKDLVFDGTFYHLWYLPALLIGILLTTWLYRTLPLPAMLAAAGLLYVVGLLGDSYYGLFKANEAFSQLYAGLFKAFDYTRNGLFYAPIYLALGAWAAKRPQPERRPLANAGLFLVSLALMLTEGMLLNLAGMPRHDSMYIFALPAAYFLFRWALQWKGRSGRTFREWRVWIYILHPIAIVLVRGAAETVHLEALLITNSLLHYVAVCLVSIVLAVVAVRLCGISLRISPAKIKPREGA
ncbi:acyltransferase [Cohnella nanjingensis]|uniref:Acyltransferase n=1 Tax=Cohnella nanjingensis TaxID=1387779 RepID=A0A7X0VGS1_9BACL|nr:acyltransferase [Cohnella nanjingensis]MBB6671919.1 acyltransferase [Cohnella nanjingensis]